MWRVHGVLAEGPGELGHASLAHLIRRRGQRQTHGQLMALEDHVRAVHPALASHQRGRRSEMGECGTEAWATHA